MRGAPTKNKFVSRLITNSDSPIPITNINKTAHMATHKPHVLVYNTKDVLDVAVSHAFYSPYSGSLVWAMCNVETAPTSTFQVDLLIDGVRVWAAGDYLTISSGSKVSPNAKRPHNAVRIIGMDSPITAPTPITVQIVTIASAGGPLTMEIGVIW